MKTFRIHEGEVEILIDHHLNQCRYYVRSALRENLDARSKASLLRCAKESAEKARDYARKIGRHFGKKSTLDRYHQTLGQIRHCIKIAVSIKAADAESGVRKAWLIGQAKDMAASARCHARRIGIHFGRLPVRSC